MSNFHLGKLIVITGKTAAGKDTIMHQILSKYPGMKRIITTTSRKIREGEKQGQHYYFISEEEFKRKILNEEFFEYVEYGGNRYGTYKSELEKNIYEDTIWRIDPSRGGQIREFIKQTYSSETAQRILKILIVIFITCSEDVILQRLKQRNLSKDEIEKRMADDAKIWQQYKDSYDFVVENVPGNLNQTIDQIVNIIENRAP